MTSISTNNLCFRLATLSDFAKVKELRRQLCLYQEAQDKQDLSGFVPYNESIDDPWLKDCLTSTSRQVYVAHSKQGNELYAYAIISLDIVSPSMVKYCTWRKKAHLIDICTNENFRRCKVATALLDFVSHKAKEEGAEFIELECYVPNTPATIFYANNGFKDVFVLKRKDL